MLDIPVNVDHEAFEENSHKFIIVEDVPVLERIIGQLIRELLDGEAMLAEAAYGVVGVVDHVGRRVRTQEVVYVIRNRHDLLDLSVLLALHVRRTAQT